jgi:formamidopyrimidine-DNA glycosylase
MSRFDTLYSNRQFTVDDKEWPPRFHKLLLDFDDGSQFAFVDARRFGRLWLQQDPEGTAPLAALGFDPYLSMPPLETFSEGLRKRGSAVKVSARVLFIFCDTL